MRYFPHILAVGSAVLLSPLLGAQVTKDQLRQKLKDDAVRGDWIYDDIDEAFRRARRSGKPILAVFRCVP